MDPFLHGQGEEGSEWWFRDIRRAHIKFGLTMASKAIIKNRTLFLNYSLCSIGILLRLQLVSVSRLLKNLIVFKEKVAKANRKQLSHWESWWPLSLNPRCSWGSATPQTFQKVKLFCKNPHCAFNTLLLKSTFKKKFLSC